MQKWRKLQGLGEKKGKNNNKKKNHDKNEKF